MGGEEDDGGGEFCGLGATELARRPYCTTSWASPLVKVTMAPFVEE